jgi:hypothetical protein
MTDIIKIIAVAYDLGNIPPKIVKSVENQTQAVKNLPVNALFFGSQEAVLFNNEIKNKFKMVFNTQLARRSIFTFTPEVPPPLKIGSIEELYEMKERERTRVMQAQKALSDLTEHLVENTDQEPLDITPEANKLFDVYLEYNGIISEELPNKFPISKISRKHKQWLALKLAGTYAILHGETELTEKMYSYAINTVELLAPNISDFERELVKEPYEQLSDMCRYLSKDGEFFLTLHELRKLSYVVGAGSSKSKVEEIARLANSYDEEGSYTVHEGGIQYRAIVKTDIVGVSYKIFQTTRVGEELKDFMARNSKEGYEFYETDFAELKYLLKENAVYCSFAFTDGIRKKENLVGGTKFVVLDIDKSMLTDHEAHVLLHDYNHFIVRTSDPNNEMKFRVLMELDSIIDVDERMWKVFLEEIAEELGLVIDVLPQSQIFLSYANRDVLSQLDGKTLKTKHLLEQAADRLREKPRPAASLPVYEKDQKLKDPRETFAYAFNAEPGERSQKMYRALAHAIDLGGDENYIRQLAEEINGCWMDPLEEERLMRTLVTPALRRIAC